MAVRYALDTRGETQWMTEAEMREWLNNWFDTGQRPHAFALSRVEVVEDRG